MNVYVCRRINRVVISNNMTSAYSAAAAAVMQGVGGWNYTILCGSCNSSSIVQDQ